MTTVGAEDENVNTQTHATTKMDANTGTSRARDALARRASKTGVAPYMLKSNCQQEGPASFTSHAPLARLPPNMQCTPREQAQLRAMVAKAFRDSHAHPTALRPTAAERAGLRFPARRRLAKPPYAVRAEGWMMCWWNGSSEGALPSSEKTRLDSLQKSTSGLFGAFGHHISLTV